MRALVHRFRNVVADVEGQDLIEYGLIVGLISIAAVVAVTAVGTTIDDLFWGLIANGLAGVA